MAAMSAKSYDYLFKLLLIGDSGVGKTSLLFRFSDDSFSATFISTIGIDFKVKTIQVGSKRVKLQIWDTAGQERFHTITTSYYRGSLGIVMVYDVTNTKSFDNMTKWLGNIEEHADSNVEKIIVGNKCDMKSARVIPTDRGSSFAHEHGIKFFETSAKANINVESVFLTMAEDILEKSPVRHSDKKTVIKPEVSNENKNCCGS